MFWEKSGELFRCLPLIETSGEEQLQFMYDIASINEENVNIPMLTARYAFLRSTSSVGAITKNSKTLGGADIEKLLKTYTPKYKADSCDKLIRSYCANESVYEICDCCPCSSTYKNANRKEEFEVLAYILSNGGPVYIDLQDLGVDDLPSLVRSQEPIPFGKVANKFVPYPLFQKIAEFMIESAVSCVSADAFWEGFSGVVYSRKAKQYKYGKIDETALSYIKNVVYSLFDAKYKELNIDSLRVLMGSTSVGNDELAAPFVEAVSGDIVSDTQVDNVVDYCDKGVAENGSLKDSALDIVVSENEDVVVLNDFFDGVPRMVEISEVESGDAFKPVELSTPSDEEPHLETGVECVDACEKPSEAMVDAGDSDKSEEEITLMSMLGNTAGDFEDSSTELVGSDEIGAGVSDGLSEEMTNEPFLALLGIREEAPPEICTNRSLSDAWDAMEIKERDKNGSVPIVSHSSSSGLSPTASAIFNRIANANCDAAADEVSYNGFLFKKKSTRNLDVLPDNVRKNYNVEANSSAGMVPKNTGNVASLMAQITGKAVYAESLKTEEPEEILDDVSDLYDVEGAVEETVSEVEHCEEIAEDVSENIIEQELTVTVNAKTKGAVSEISKEDFSEVTNSGVLIQLYRESVSDGMIEAIEFKEGNVLCPGTIVKYNKEVFVAKNSDSKVFIDFCRAVEGAKDIPIDVAKVNNEVGLLILLDKMYFTSYNSDAYGVLHSVFSNVNIRKICFDMYVLAQYVYMYDSVFEGVHSIVQYANMGVDISSVVGLEDYVSFVSKQNAYSTRAHAEYLAFVATHALSSDVGGYIDAKIVNGSSGFVYDYKGAVGVNGRDYGVVFELSGFNKDVDSGIGFDKILLNSIRMLFYSHIIHKYNLKIVEIGDSFIKIYAPYNVYEVLDMLILAFSNSIKQLTNGVPSFSCVPTFVKKSA